MMIYSILIGYLRESMRLVPFVSQIIPVHVISSHFYKIQFNIILVLCHNHPSRPFTPFFIPFVFIRPMVMQKIVDATKVLFV
jgi:hypothetical protein